MTTRSASQVFTGLTNEPFFISCRKKLRAKNGTQRLKLVSIDAMRLERADSQGRWTIVLEKEAFGVLDILDDGSFERALIFGTTPSPTFTIEYPASNQDAENSMFAGNPTKRGQLVHVPGVADITQLSFHLRKSGSPTGNGTVEIYASDGTVPLGSALASETFDVTALSTSLAVLPVPLSTPARIATPGWYGFVAGYDGGDISNRVVTGLDSSAPSHAGHTIGRSAAGVWTATPATDHIFAIAGTWLLAPSDRYRLVAECTCEYLPAFGSGQVPMVFRAPAKVVASALNPVES